LGPDILPGEYVQLAVKDTGGGMAPDVMKRIFEPFFTTREVGKGTGMGLAMVFGIVKDLQGTVTVESTPGGGSTFRVFLPNIRLDVHSERTTPEGSVRGNERVLFVDDERLLAELGRERLNRLGYTVTASSDATEALKLFSRDPSQFDLVITDQSMPKLTGLHLARKLLKIRSDIPIILLTGHSDSVTPEKVKQAGIKEFLMKPLAKEELASVVRRVLDAII
jgi:CheY-like chemotaxis protein